MSYYVTVEDIDNRLAQLDFMTTTRPTAATIADIIDEVEAIVNGTVAALSYTVPVTQSQPIAFKQLKTATIDGAICRVLNAYLGVQPEENPREELYCERFQSFLKRVKEMPEILSDAGLASSSESGLAGITATSANYQEPRITMGKKL